MPIVSEAQRGAMYAAKEGHSTLDIPANVGRKFVAAGPANSPLPKYIHRRKMVRRAAKGK